MRTNPIDYISWLLLLKTYWLQIGMVCWVRYHSCYWHFQLDAGVGIGDPATDQTFVSILQGLPLYSNRIQTILIHNNFNFSYHLLHFYSAICETAAQSTVYIYQTSYFGIFKFFTTKREHVSSKQMINVLNLNIRWMIEAKSCPNHSWFSSAVHDWQHGTTQDSLLIHTHQSHHYVLKQCRVGGECCQSSPAGKIL